MHLLLGLQCWLHCSTHSCYSSPLQVTRGLFGSSKGSFTSFFTRTGYGGGSPGQGMEASIHGGAMGGFRQVRCVDVGSQGLQGGC